MSGYGMPPNDIAAEQAVVGAMMLPGAALADVAPILGPEDHFRPAHQIVHRAILDLAGRGEPHDPIAVRAELQRRGELRGQLDGNYLADLIAAVPVAANAAHYARIVAGHARSRQAIAAGTRLIQAAGSPGGLDTVLPDVSAALAELGGQRPAASDRAAVETQKRALRARQAAESEMLAETARPVPVPVRLDKFLAEPDEPAAYRVDRLWPAGGRVILAAQRKAGKTTFAGNLLRSLADGDPFLGRYAVTPVTDGTVFCLDTEMDRRMLRGWLADQNIAHPERVHVEPLRGAVSSFAILDPGRRAEWAAVIRGCRTRVLLVDCIGPLLAALGLDESSGLDVGRFLTAFEELLADAGVTELGAWHHMGHTGERSRGASRLRDWPDAEWKLLYEPGENGAEPGPDARRYFSALGRDVGEPEQLLDHDPASRHLAVAGGSRRDERTAGLLTAITAYIDAPGRGEADCSQSRIEASVEGRAADIRAVMAADVQAKDGRLCAHRRGQARIHRVRDKCSEHRPGAAADQLFDDTPQAPETPTPSDPVPPPGTGVSHTPSPRPKGTGYKDKRPAGRKSKSTGTGSAKP